MELSDVADRFDHTCLRADAVDSEIESLCAEAVELGVASVCVPPNFVRVAKRKLLNSSVAVGSVVGFPFGYTTIDAKVSEARALADAGALELDMVIALRHVVLGAWDSVADEIAQVRKAVPNTCLKVIVESAYWDAQVLRRLAKVVLLSGADFIKTSTGFGPGGATVEAVQIMHDEVGDRMGIKASGGIRSAADARCMFDAGATRIGASATRKILAGFAS